MQKICPNQKCSLGKMRALLDGKYCITCGTKLKELNLPTCRNCSTELVPNAQFCSECGIPRKEALGE